MALDTRDKRASAIHVGCPWRGLLPTADGSINGSDRKFLLALFATGLQAYSLTVEAGAFTLTGQSVALEMGRRPAVETGSFSLTGQDTTGKYYNLWAEAGSFTLTGQSVGLVADRTLGAGAGSYTLSGQDVGLTADRSLAAGAGSFTLTGQDADLRKGVQPLTVGTGSFTFTGQDVTLQAPGVVLSVETGTFTFTGQDVGLATYKLTAETGTFALSGQDVGLYYGGGFSVGTGTFTVSGMAAYFGRTSSPQRVLIQDADAIIFATPASFDDLIFDSPSYGDQLFKPGI